MVFESAALTTGSGKVPQTELNESSSEKTSFTATEPLSSVNLLSTLDLKPSDLNASTKPQTDSDLSFSNVYEPNADAKEVQVAAVSREARESDAPAPAEQPPKSDKPLRRSDIPDFEKFTPKKQEETAKDLASKIADKKFTPDPKLRDSIREAILRVYMDGDVNGAGNQKALEKFVEQMSNNLPKGMSLKLDSSENNKAFTDFREKAKDAIAKQPGMKMGSCAQIQLVQTGADGKQTVVDKMHYAASIRQAPKAK